MGVRVDLSGARKVPPPLRVVRTTRGDFPFSAGELIRVLAHADPVAFSKLFSERGGALNGLFPRQKAFFLANLVALAGQSRSLVLRPNLNVILGDVRGQALARKAGRITVKGFERIREQLKPGMTELEVARLFERAVKEHGADGLGFETIVLTGSHAALIFSKIGAHVGPTGRKIKAGEMVLVDAGAAVAIGRKSSNQMVGADMTRTFAIGRIGLLQERMYRLVLQAQRAAVGAVAAGVAAGRIDQIARKSMPVELRDFFSHSTGHGIAVAEDRGSLHGLPVLRSFVPSALQPGQIVTVEPGLYIGREGKDGYVRKLSVPGWGAIAAGVRIEDTVRVTEDGCEVLTEFPRGRGEMTIPVPYGT